MAMITVIESNHRDKREFILKTDDKDIRIASCQRKLSVIYLLSLRDDACD